MVIAKHVLSINFSNTVVEIPKIFVFLSHLQPFMWHVWHLKMQSEYAGKIVAHLQLVMFLDEYNILSQTV
jgi:hypothetical protein